MRANRLLAILLYLQAHGRLTARELAETLEVSERTIYRDMLDLSAAGIPVVASRGNNGGWQLLDGYRTNLTGLNAAEIQTLFVAHPMLAELGLQETAEAALLKLLAALPAIHRHNADYIRQRLHIDLAGWNRSREHVEALPILQEAVWQGCKVTIRYQRSDSSTVERVINPLGLVAKGSIWYLVAAVESEIRTYRVSRVMNAAIMDEPAQRPEDFDLAAYWAQSTAEFIASLPSYPVVLRVSPELLPRLRYGIRFARIKNIDSPDADGWSQVQIEFDLPEEACEFVLGYGANIEVIDPPELREQVIQNAKALIAFYAATHQA